MQFVFYIASFNALFFALLLSQKKPRATHDIILIVWLIYLALFIGVYSLYSHHLFTHFNILSANLISMFMLLGVFLFLYVARLVSKQKKFNKKNLLHLLPFITFNVYLLVASFYPHIAREIRIEHIHTTIHPPLLFLFFLILTLLSGPFYFVFTLILLRKHNLSIFNNFSSAENVNLEWLRKLILVFGLIWTILIAITLIHHVFNLFSMVFCTDSLFMALSVFVILIGYYGLKQKVIFVNEYKEQQQSVEEKTKYSGSGLKEDESFRYSKQLSEFMHSEKPYLNPDLTLQQLASQVNISPHHLSQVINEQFKANFFEYINRFRVEEVKSRINNPKFDSFSLLGIAFDSGFNSKSAFNRIFKKITNQTPSEYKSGITEK